MAGPPPTAAFASVTLDIHTVAVGARFGRIHRRAYPDPLSFGKNASRFSDPRKRIEGNRFGVLYLGSSLQVCFVETIVRDRRDGLVGDVEIEETEIDDRLYTLIHTLAPLRLIDLTGNGPVRMGIPSDVVRGRTQALARKWSLAIHAHPATVDGILYPSRLNDETNLAIYDRAIAKLDRSSTVDLHHAPGMADALVTFSVALV